MFSDTPTTVVSYVHESGTTHRLVKRLLLFVGVYFCLPFVRVSFVYLCRSDFPTHRTGPIGVAPVGTTLVLPSGKRDEGEEGRGVIGDGEGSTILVVSGTFQSSQTEIRVLPSQ